MVKIFACSKCGPSREAISHIHFKNNDNDSIVRLIVIKEGKIQIKYSSTNSKFDDEYIEEYICSDCGGATVISFLPDFFLSVTNVKNDNNIKH